MKSNFSVSSNQKRSLPAEANKPREVVNFTTLGGTGVRLYSFEKMFFIKSFFLGEYKLDKALMSLIHLDESCKTFRLFNNYDILLNTNIAEKKIMSADRKIKKRYSLIKKQKDFNILDFLLENNIPFDRITGCFPMIFENHWLVSHSLHMAWAFYLTMKMKKLDKFKYPQRIRGSRFESKNGNYLTSIFLHIYSQFKRLNLKSEKDLVKCLKNSLCYHVSLELNQEEFPEGQRIDMVPLVFKHIFDKLEEKEKINFFFSLLQSKVLCRQVPDDFILDTLIKHRDTLASKPEPLSPSIKKVLYERGLSFGKLVKKYYKPNKGYQPSNRATYDFPRNSGGVKGDLVYNNVLGNGPQLNYLNQERLEPLVIGLFGQPGMGKSSWIPELISILRPLFPGIKRQDLTYSRTCHVEHWDGYKNQPIVILDDLGQSLEGNDIKEFQTLVSCNPYVLPMADLADKGKQFSSPIIIVTSNLQYMHRLPTVYQETAGILDDLSFWRRFTIPLFIEDRKIYQLRSRPIFERQENLVFRKGISNALNGCRVLCPTDSLYFPDIYPRNQYINSSSSPTDIRVSQLWKSIDQIFFLGEEIREIYVERLKGHDNIRLSWIQYVNQHTDNIKSLVGGKFFMDQIDPYISLNSITKEYETVSANNHTLEFPAYPPISPLPVRVVPITEPLKVRVITAGKGETFCLKPFQVAMWQALGLEQQFSLTHGTNNLEKSIKDIYDKSSINDVWISGDYTAATDSIPLEASKALMEGILESIEHEPTKRWIMKELSPHMLVYPEDSEISPTLQESGQLMGSLLSFPLLCLLNDCTARSIGLKPHQYLINGDDILIRTRRENYPKWKKTVKDYGFSLSLGKNYVHSKFGTVNSQLICEGKVLNSGKQRVLDRRSQVLGECLRDLEYLMEDSDPSEVQDLFKSINRSKLSRTVRSISVPTSHGGLSLNWNKDYNKSNVKTLRTDLLVYLHDLFRKIEPKKGCITIPYLSNVNASQQSVEEMDQIFNDCVPLSEYHEDFIGVPDLKRIQKRIYSNSSLRDLFLSQDIRDLPSLTFLKCTHVPFTDVKVRKEIQSEVDRLFFINFLDPDVSFSYEAFRALFLEAVRGIPSNCKESTKYLSPLMDLEVGPEYLEKVITGYKSKPFSKEQFEKNLGKALNPRGLEIPIPLEYDDYSKEVIDSFNYLVSTIKSEQENWEYPIHDFQAYIGKFGLDGLFSPMWDDELKSVIIPSITKGDPWDSLIT